jgi:hypothetical protein
MSSAQLVVLSLNPSLLAPFDFISSIPRGVSITSATVECSVYSGVDSDAADMIVGEATVRGTKVIQRVGGGVAGVLYRLDCTVVTSGGSTTTMSAYLNVTQDRRLKMPGGRRVDIPKKATETVVNPFDFAASCEAGETLLSATVTAEVYSGVDAAPEDVIFGTATVSGTKAYQRLRGGVAGVTYALTCSVTTTGGQELDQTQYLTIITKVP